ncbi:MAG: hypothetical protein WBD34_04820 [Burkholderiaceae bacterium]
MITLARALMTFLLLPCVVQAQEMRFRIPLLTVTLSPQVVRVQQQLVQSIRLESNFPFQSMRVDFGEPADAEIVELQAAGTREFKTWANAGWVYEASRAFFPARSGQLTVPAVHITGETLLPSGVRQAFDVRSEPVQLEVGTPTLDMTGEPWLVGDQVTITERWSVLPDLLRAGEIAIRTIEVRAEGVTGQHIGDLKMPVSLGLQVLPGRVSRRTEITSGTAIGFLSQDFEIRVLNDTKTDISPVQIAWWDARENRKRRSAVRAYRVEPLPADVQAIVAQIIGDEHAKRLRSARTLMWLIVGGATMLSFLSVLLLLFAPVRRVVTRQIGALADFLFGPSQSLPEIGLHLRPESVRTRGGADNSDQKKWEHVH